MKNTIIIANNKDRPTPFSFSRFKKPYSSSRIEAIHINSIKLKEKTKKEQKIFSNHENHKSSQTFTCIYRFKTIFCLVYIIRLIGLNFEDVKLP